MNERNDLSLKKARKFENEVEDIIDNGVMMEFIKERQDYFRVIDEQNAYIVNLEERLNTVLDNVQTEMRRDPHRAKPTMLVAVDRDSLAEFLGVDEERASKQNVHVELTLTD